MFLSRRIGKAGSEVVPLPNALITDIKSLQIMDFLLPSKANEIKWNVIETQIRKYTCVVWLVSTAPETHQRSLLMRGLAAKVQAQRGTTEYLKY